MKVLRIISSMDPKTGGPCQGIRNNIPAQEVLGVHSEIVCFDAPDADFLLKETLKVHAIGPAKGPYAYCRNLEKWLKKNLFRFDVVIIHGLWLYNSYGTYRIWERYKKESFKVPKLYVMPHGMLDPYFQRTKSRRLKAIRNWIFWKLIENKVINGANGLLFTCEQEMLLARETFRPYFPKSEINIGYGVQLPPESDANCELEFLLKCPRVAGRPYFLFLSRIHPKKGVDNLIKAYKIIKKDLGHIPDLVIAGPGMDTEFGKSMRKLAGNERIHFPEMLEGSSKWGAFYGCKAFILPSHQENFGIAVVEALACEKAVLITNKVNIYREIESSGSGLVGNDTFTGISQLLEKWMKMPESEKNEMGKKAGELYRHQFGIGPAAVKFRKKISYEQIRYY